MGQVGTAHAIQAGRTVGVGLQLGQVGAAAGPAALGEDRGLAFHAQEQDVLLAGRQGEAELRLQPHQLQAGVQLADQGLAVPQGDGERRGIPSSRTTWTSRARGWITRMETKGFSPSSTTWGPRTEKGSQ